MVADDILYGITTAFSISPLWVSATAIITLLLSFLLNCVLLARMSSVIGFRFNRSVDKKAESKFRKRMDQIANSILTFLMISYVFTILASRDVFSPQGLLLYAGILFLWLGLPSLLWLRRAYANPHARNLVILHNILQICFYSILGFLILQMMFLSEVSAQTKYQPQKWYPV